MTPQLNRTIPLLFIFFLFYTPCTQAQKIVQVKDEPRHLPVLLNKYVRVINATIEDEDTSFFHIHAIPSAFIFLTDMVYDDQKLGGEWKKATSKKGYAWYSSFSSGPATHRVAAPKNERIHAYDVELLSGYEFTKTDNWQALLTDTLFDADKCVAYRLELNSAKPSFVFSGRGPIVAVVVSGEEISISQPEFKSSATLHEEDYGYVRPDLSTTFLLKKGKKASLVLFEIK
jgi:hypothetical protein